MIKQEQPQTKLEQEESPTRYSETLKTLITENRRERGEHLQLQIIASCKIFSTFFLLLPRRPMIGMKEVHRPKSFSLLRIAAFAMLRKENEKKLE